MFNDDRRVKYRPVHQGNPVDAGVVPVFHRRALEDSPYSGPLEPLVSSTCCRSTMRWYRLSPCIKSVSTGPMARNLGGCALLIAQMLEPYDAFVERPGPWITTGLVGSNRIGDLCSVAGLLGLGLVDGAADIGRNGEAGNRALAEAAPSRCTGTIKRSARVLGDELAFAVFGLAFVEPLACCARRRSYCASM